MAYKRTEWVDHIVSPTGEVLQEGTPISAANLNKIEEGIEKLSTDLGSIKVPPASLTEPGIVQLSNATNSTDETMAATPKAVHDVSQTVKEIKTSLDSHVTDTTKHVTVDERLEWNSKAPASHKHDASDITTGTMAAARLPGASTSAAGIVQLSTATNGTRANVAATESAVKAAYDRANEAFQSGVEWRGRIAGAINAKGVPASAADVWPTLEWKIGQITTGVPMARIRTNVSEWPQNFHISEDGTVTWSLYYIMVTGLSFQTKGIVVLNSAFRVMAAYDFYTNPGISVDGAHYNHQVVYRDTLPQLSGSIFATITPTSFVAPVTRYDTESKSQVHVIAYG